MMLESTVATKLNYDLMVLNQTRSTGKLVITCEDDASSQWQLYFYKGQLIYATGEKYRVHRWYQFLGQHCPQIVNDRSGLAVPLADPWELYLLNQSIRQGKITTDEAKAVVQDSVQDVLVAVHNQQKVDHRWQSGKQNPEPSAFLDIGPMMLTAFDWCDPWQTALSAQTIEAPKSFPEKGVISCIDNSPTVLEEMKRILTPAGYEVLPIVDPLQDMSKLLTCQPKVIFLDLMISQINGYELCTFLSRNAALQNTSIVILTGQNGVVDRVRARLVGSSDFINKPFDEIEVLQIVDRYSEPAL